MLPLTRATGTTRSFSSPPLRSMRYCVTPAAPCQLRRTAVVDSTVATGLAGGAGATVSPPSATVFELAARERPAGETAVTEYVWLAPGSASVSMKRASVGQSSHSGRKPFGATARPMA